MPFLLDTNAVIALMKGNPDVMAHIRRVGRSEIMLCAPVEAELWFGVYKSRKLEDNRNSLLALLSWLPSLPFAGEATRYFGEVRAELARQGKPIGPYDLQIAAMALAHDLTLITDNTDEFSRIPGLRVENWQRGVQS
jgi:tRNA(fMet)-specific endonuclease VapC